MLHNFFTKNRAAKFGSLVIAIGIWAFAVSGATRTDVFPASIPITVQHAPADLAATLTTDSVKIRISAEEAVWRQLQSQSFSATVDLSSVKAGVSEVSVQVIVLVPNVQLVEVVPRTVVVQLEPLVSRSEPVQIRTQGEPAAGFFASDATSDPVSVTVRGATSLIDRLDQVTGVIDITGASNDRDGTVLLQAVDSTGHALPDVIITPKSVKVHQQLTKLAATKSVGVRVVTTGVPPDGKIVSPVLTKPQTVTLAGSKLQLSLLSTIPTKPIDISKLTQGTTVKTVLDLPAGITVTGGDTASIDVTFDVSDQDAVRTIQAPLTLSGLATDRRVISSDPATAMIVVHGPTAAIQNLKPTDVPVNIDLTGAGIGDKIVPITASQITLPASVLLQQIITSSINVKIE